LGSSTFRLSAASVSTSLTGSRFSSRCGVEILGPHRQLDLPLSSPMKALSPFLGRQLNERQYSATVRSVRIAERFTHLQVIVVRGFNQFDWFSCCLYGSREVAVLPLELRGLVRTVGNDDRCAQKIKMTLRTHLIFHVIVEFDIVAAFRHPHLPPVL